MSSAQIGKIKIGEIILLSHKKERFDPRKYPSVVRWPYD